MTTNSSFPATISYSFSPETLSKKKCVDFSSYKPVCVIVCTRAFEQGFIKDQEKDTHRLQEPTHNDL